MQSSKPSYADQQAHLSSPTSEVWGGENRAIAHTAQHFTAVLPIQYMLQDILWKNPRARWIKKN